MPVRIVTQPTIEPVTLAEAKAHLRLEESLDDAFVLACVVAARQHIERVCWRGLLLQTLELTQASFRGADKQEQLPDFIPAYAEPTPVEGSRFQPFIELTGGHLADTPNISVTYLDENGTQQTLSPSAYVVQGLGNDSMAGRLWLNEAGGYSWPNTLSRFDAVKVQYTVGWATQNLLPIGLKHAVLLLVSHMYENRTPVITGTIAVNLELTLDALMQPFRLARL